MSSNVNQSQRRLKILDQRLISDGLASTGSNVLNPDCRSIPRRPPSISHKLTNASLFLKFLKFAFLAFPWNSDSGSDEEVNDGDVEMEDGRM